MSLSQCNARAMTNTLIESIENGELDWEYVCREALSYLSEDEVADMIKQNDLLPDVEEL